MSKFTTLLALALLLAACGETSAVRAVVEPAAPLSDVENAFALAQSVATSAPPPVDYPGLHNVVRLSRRIISGSEPHGPAAFEAIAGMGVKTILSVDGKVPDAFEAEKHGMRYVHVPIQYSGIKPAELARIAKTFRELEGPFFVHCFHGKHRGPAAAAVGRVVLDGVSRETAMAEMVHCGTAGTYEGLYQTIGLAVLPGSQETNALAWSFDAAHPIEGIRGGMIQLARSFDPMKAAAKRAWTVDPEHPDIDPAHEAAKIAELFEAIAATDELKQRPADYRGWMDESVVASRALRDGLRAGTAEGREGVARHFAATRRLCLSCHKAYRNID